MRVIGGDQFSLDWARSVPCYTVHQSERRAQNLYVRGSY